MTRVRLPLSPCGILAAALMVLPITPVHADGLVDNVNGITMNEKGELVRFNGLLIDKDGNVSQLLNRQDKRPKQVDFKSDAKGKTMLPGIIDAHGHVMG
ncbi:MAG: amidohydrolase, partial [Sphingorhabdus sp.]|nr:amidohydrolase [Sphingorhabdus sp.]